MKSQATDAISSAMSRLDPLAGRHGRERLWTGNEDTNAAMLAINRQLGYCPAPRAVEVSREL